MCETGGEQGHFPQGRVRGVRHVPPPFRTSRTSKHAQNGVFWCSARPLPFPSSRTPQTDPCGSVCGVRRVLLPFGTSRTPEHVPQGRVLMFGVFSPFPSRRTRRTCPLWACSSCSARSLHSSRVAHHEHAHKGMFLMFDMFSAVPLALNTMNMLSPPGTPEMCPSGHVFGVWRLPEPPTPSFPEFFTLYF